MNPEKKNLLLFVVILVLALIFWSSYEAQKTLTDFFRTSEGFINNHPFLSVLAFVVLGALSAMFVFLSSVVLVPIASFSWGAVPTFLIFFGSWLLGGALTYAVGKYFGRTVVEKIFSPQRVASYESKISPILNFPLVFLFRLAMPAEIPGYLLGMLRYHFPKYLLATALAELPFAVGAVSASEFFLKKDKILFTGLLLAGLVLISVALYLFKRKANNVK